MIRTHSELVMESDASAAVDASGAVLPPDDPHLGDHFDPLDHQCFGFSEREAELEYLRGNLKLAWKEIRDLQESRESLQDLVVTLNSRMNHLENLLTAKLQNVPALIPSSTRSMTPGRRSVSHGRIVA